MSNVPHVWGYGNFAIKRHGDTEYNVFSCSETDLQFPESDGSIEKNLDYDIIDNYEGRRAELSVKIKSITTTSYKDLLELIAILDTRSFDIIPFYQDDILLENLLVLTKEKYDMREVSGLTISKLHQFLESGQDISIKFQARKLVTHRPFNHSDEDALGVATLGGENVRLDYIE